MVLNEHYILFDVGLTMLDTWVFKKRERTNIDIEIDQSAFQQPNDCQRLFFAIFPDNSNFFQHMQPFLAVSKCWLTFMLNRKKHFLRAVWLMDNFLWMKSVGLTFYTLHTLTLCFIHSIR